MADTEPPTADLLLVEDDADIGHLLGFLFEREGFTVSRAQDGLEAQDRIKNGPAPMAALVDLMLPYMDGFELIRLMRSQDAWRQVPVLVLSAKSREEDLIRALDYGANDYIEKPFRPGEVVARVRRATRNASLD